jgi:SPP1 gp7 family putative phage head morphogenesis protein
MPVERCAIGGKAGYRFGMQGKCFTGPGARSKAVKQGQAIKASQKTDSEFTERKQKETVQLRAVKKASGVSLPPLAKLPHRQQSGKTLEREYFTIINNLLKPYYAALNRILIPLIPRITQSFQQQTRTDEQMRLDNYWEMITRSMNEISVSIGLQIFDSQIRSDVSRMGVKTSNFNRNQVDGQFRSVLGMNPLRTEPYLEPQLQAFTARNTALIKSIPTQSLNKIETLVRTAVEQGATSKTLAVAIQKEIKSTKSRAKLIARDQINKFNGKLTQLRQAESGVEEYIWSTSRDERVRHSHSTKDGKIFKWSKPPSDTGHPGEDIQCRCVAIPILNPLKAPPSISSELPIGAVIAGVTVLAGDE